MSLRRVDLGKLDRCISVEAAWINKPSTDLLESNLWDRVSHFHVAEKIFDIQTELPYICPFRKQYLVKYQTNKSNSEHTSMLTYESRNFHSLP